MATCSLTTAGAQTLRLRADKELHEATNDWPVSFRYGFGSDFADTRTPRAWNNALGLSFGHNLSEHWSAAVDLGVSAVFVDGKIDKDKQETYAETVNPSTALGLEYGRPFFGRHNWTFGVSVEPLWDEPSRIEGYKGIAGAYTGVTFKLFSKMYTMSHTLSFSNLINSFPYDSEGGSNPDYFYIYGFSNSIRFLKTYKAFYNFGIKMTRYLDGFLSYNYTNTIGLGRSWDKTTVSLTYENGGFTENGDFSLWYLDRYRRLVRLNIGYSF